jgi:hypothetical protein
MSVLSKLALAAFLGGLGAAVGADTLDMSAAEAKAQFDAAGKPTRGMSQARVEANYGEPESRRSAVGDPPISRWDYAEFVVYFEYDKVIHSVSKM